MARRDQIPHSWLRSALDGQKLCVRHDAFDAESYASQLTLANAGRLLQLKKSLPAAEAVVADLFFLLFKGAIRFADYDALQPQGKYHRAMIEEKVLSAPVFHEARAHCFMHARASFEAALASAAALCQVLSASELSETQSIDEADRALQNAMGTLKGVKGARASMQMMRVQEKNAEEQENFENAQLLNRLKNGQNFGGAKAVDRDSNVEHGRHSRHGADILSHHERFNLKEQLMAVGRFRKFLELTFALKHQLTAIRDFLALQAEEVHSVTAGSDFAMLLPSELAALASTTAKKGFFKRLVEGELMSYDMNYRRRRGPLVVCIDTSHSMRGDNEILSKALGLALREIAKADGRDFRAILFGGKDEQTILDFSADGREALIDLAEFNFGAGTNFERPLLTALDMQIQSGLPHGDIVFMTDGRAEISPSVRDRICWHKKKRQLRVTALVMNLGRNSEASLNAPLSDRILFAGDLVGRADSNFK